MQAGTDKQDADNPMIRLLPGDCREVLATLPADSVHCVVTSPPYYGLRDYGTAQWAGGDDDCSHLAAASGPTQNKGNNGRNGQPFRDTCGKCGATRVDRQIGLEATPDAYLAEMVGVFREVRRVLRPDGTCWVNMGDSYASSGQRGHNGWDGNNKNPDGTPRTSRQAGDSWGGPTAVGGIKPKDLLMMPARLALALQADGWWLRSAITWCKPSPMPESVTDRPTSATEMVYLLTKQPRYFYDGIAIREQAVSDHPSGNGYKRDPRLSYADSNGARGDDQHWNGVGGTRNARNWWVINSQPYSEAHFATFPPALAERCIRAGTSERGCCAACGAPWGRVVERHSHVSHPQPERPLVTGATRNALGGQKEWDGYVAPTTTGWAPSCACTADTVPCTVLDPFAGAGTTLLVADRLQRDAIGIELNPDYTRMAMDRCRDDAPLFASQPPAEPPEDARVRDLFAEPLAAD